MNPADQFETIVSEHYEPLLKFAIRLARVEADARDLTQQTFYIWALKGHQLRDFSKVKTWLFTTLHRMFLVTRRRQTRFPHDDLETVSEKLADLSPPPHPSPELDSSGIQPILAQLDEAYRAAVTLFYLEERSYPEIALLLGVPVGTVKSRVARGVAQLRRLLDSSESAELLTDCLPVSRCVPFARKVASPRLAERDLSAIRFREHREAR